MNETKQIFNTLELTLYRFDSRGLHLNVRTGTLAASLHDFYNKVGLKEGWLKPEYATPLSQQDKVNKLKNVLAAKDVVKYWFENFEMSGEITDNNLQLVEDMKFAVDYEENRGNFHLEMASESQHNQWRKFVLNYQKERITRSNPKFREDNYRQYASAYSKLSEKEKDQDRLIVAVVTDKILEKARIGYKRKIK